MAQNNCTKGVYTAIVAFSTPSGALHVGHALGHIVADTTTRIEGMAAGLEIFIPFGIHSTGKDLYKILDDIAQGENPEMYGLKQQNAVAIKQGTRQEQVNKLVDYYRATYQKSLKSLGIPVDSESFFSTHEAAYHTFVTWTLSKLKERSLIVKTLAGRPYCEVCQDIKAIEKDQSEAYAKGPVDWSKVRIDSTGILGGEFYCRIHKNQQLTVKIREENAIDYGNREYQEKTIELIRKKLKTFPPGYKIELEDIVRTRKEKPMERNTETNIGTPSPFNPKAVIEALADSNIYMEYFAVAKAISKKMLSEAQLGSELYDYIFLDLGNASALEQKLGIKNIEQVKDYINRYSSIGLNLSGFEHKEVHFPFSLFTHAAILPERYFPKELILTSHVTRNGEKMSKSKGNVLYLDEILDKIRKEHIAGISEDAAIDSIRYFLIGAQPLDKDLDWKDSFFMESGLGRIKKYVAFVNAAMTKNISVGADPALNNWLSTGMYFGMRKGLGLYLSRDFRAAMVEGFEKTFNSISKYINLNNGNVTPLVHKAIQSQLMFAMPVIPRIAAELYAQHFGGTIDSFPDHSVFSRNLEDYDRIEHLTNSNFVSSRMRFVNSRIGQLKGRNMLDSSQPVEILVSSSFTKGILGPHLQKQKSLQGIDYLLSVIENSEPEEMQIKHNNLLLK